MGASDFANGGLYVEQVGGLPASGALNALVSFAGVLYRWSGAAWIALTGSTAAGSTFYEQDSTDPPPAIANTTALETFTSFADFPADLVTPGASGRIVASGSWIAAASPDLTVSVLVNDVVVLTQTITATLNGQWFVQLDYTVDAGGVVVTTGLSGLQLGTAPTTFGLGTLNAGAGAFAVEVAAQWSVASASNSIDQGYFTATRLPGATP